jgi:tRNA (adenine22-N1)-methyltransferase
MIRLRPVLRKIYDNLLPNQPVWDLCCDHGLLGEAAIHTGISSEVHFVDQSIPVMETLRRQKQDLVGATFYLLNAAHLPGPVSGSVVISGVGSHTVIKILDNLKWISSIRLLISSNNKPELLKEYFFRRGWDKYITEHTSVEENHRKRLFFRIDLPAND